MSQSVIQKQHLNERRYVKKLEGNPLEGPIWGTHLGTCFGTHFVPWASNISPGIIQLQEELKWRIHNLLEIIVTKIPLFVSLML